MATTNDKDPTREEMLTEATEGLVRTAEMIRKRIAPDGRVLGMSGLTADVALMRSLLARIEEVARR